ncbi:MAG: hypothetical protein LUG93_14780 [Lachnospiraceae bacterium]|nr:hypothetical protein [Lachnospiraceae bacterium]
MANLRRQVSRENEAQRNIETIGFPNNISSFFRRFRSYDNLLLHGSGAERESALWFWLRRLFLDEQLFGRPVIVISSKSDPADRLLDAIDEGSLPCVRSMLKISVGTPEYNPFLELPPENIRQAVLAIARHDESIHMDLWDNALFQAVCDTLVENGYVISLDNLAAIFRNAGARSGAFLSDLLSTSGREYEALSARRNPERVAEMNSIFSSLQRKWKCYAAGRPAEERHSLYELVKQKSETRGHMPFVYFSIKPQASMEILECLAQELRAISMFGDPILVIDSVDLRQRAAGTDFYDYITTSHNLTLTLTADDCTALIPGAGDEGELDKILAQYGFTMVLLNGTKSVEKLTKTVGTYTRLVLEEGTGITREFLEIFTFDNPRHEDQHIREVSDTLRIRFEDMDQLRGRQCYVCEGSNITLYTNMNFFR